MPMKPAAPARVDDVKRYWAEAPPITSERCAWWLKRIVEERWRGNKRIRGLGYHDAAEYFGVYIWEWNEVLFPALEQAWEMGAVA